jgi:hypothetical protein
MGCRAAARLQLTYGTMPCTAADGGLPKALTHPVTLSDRLLCVFAWEEKRSAG